MLRCALGVLLATLLALPAAAQLPRNFNNQALRGEIVFGTPPQITLNGKPTRLAPGARIHDRSNLVLLPGTLAGGKAVVNYTTDLEGMLLQVWILRPEEIARQPWPRTVQEAQTWTFDDSAQKWTKP